MRTFVISDIHGNNELFRKALKHVALKKSDKLILLGDLIDRGDQSKEVLDTILLLMEHNFKVELIYGNHEIMMLDSFTNLNSLNSWLLNGGNKTLSSFLTSSIEKIPAKYIKLIRSSKYYLEVDNYILVHAALNMMLENPFEDKETMLWERNWMKYYNPEWLNGRIVIHGHSPTAQNIIAKSVETQQDMVCIDNGSFLKKPDFGSLCILELGSNKIEFII